MERQYDYDGLCGHVNKRRKISDDALAFCIAIATLLLGITIGFIFSPLF